MADNETPPGRPRVEFAYLKNAQFRNVHVDGLVGGWTPRGFLHLSFFAERSPLPQRSVHEVGADGGLTAGEMIGPPGDRFEREFEVDLFMTEATARDMKAWLDDKLSQLESIKRGSN